MLEIQFTLANQALIVYGNGDLDVNCDTVKQNKPELLPCESCERILICIGNLEDRQKRLLAELVVHRYRKIIEECGTQKITVIDFLMLIMERVHKVCEQEQLRYPIRQNIYAIAKELFSSVSDKFQILGTLDLSQEQMTSSFHQQLRKYEQLGLIAYVREIRRLESEDRPRRQVFRFDRRFYLSPHGKMWLDKIRSRFGQIKEFEDYKQCWDELSRQLDMHETFIRDILLQGTGDEQSPYLG